MIIKDILKYTGGTLLQGSAQNKVSGISTDSRTVKRGELFIALKGKNFDGHKFLDTAAKKQAAAFLVSKKIQAPQGVAVILCKDTTTSYSDIASGYRDRFKIPVVGITGSVGKTTTKELMAAVLSKRFNVLKNFQTENNEIGVSKTLLKLTPKHKAAVLEFGTNHFDEIKRLASVGKPTIAVMTNIGDSHLEFLKNRQGVFREKSSIFRASPLCRTIIYNNDDPLLRKITGIWGQTPKGLTLKGLTPRRITFGIDQKADYQAKNICFKGTGLSFSVKGHAFSLKTLSRDNIYNALAGIAAARLLGVSFASIRRSLALAPFPAGRQNISRKGGIWVIDDTYNANPTSTASALRTLSSFPSKGKKVFVFGDMLELGRASGPAHLKIGALTAASKVDTLFTFGRWSKLTSQTAGKRGISVKHFRSHEEILTALKKILKPGDVVLVKGSHSMHMEKVVANLGSESRL